jgi:hypothetical protein
MVLASLDDAIQPSTKCLSPGKEVILNPAVLVASCVVAPASKLSPEEDVIDLFFLKRCLKGLTVELRVQLAVWDGSQIRYRCHLVLVQQRRELL